MKVDQIEARILNALKLRWGNDTAQVEKTGEGILVISNMYGYKFKVEITCIQEPHTTEAKLQETVNSLSQQARLNEFKKAKDAKDS